MQKRQIKNNVNLYFLENDAYKTNRISINFYAKLERKTAGFASVLTKLMIRANKNIKTSLELERELNKLYGASIFSSYSKFGEVMCYSFGFDVLKDKYAGEAVEDKALSILADCVLHQTDFNEEYFLRRGRPGGNESIAGGAERNARIAIFGAASTRARSGTILTSRPEFAGECSAGARG